MNLDQSVDSVLAARLRALGHTTRVRVLRLLSSGGPQRLGVLARSMDIGQSLASEHVAILRRAGLLHLDAEGRYALDHTGIRHLKDLVDRMPAESKPGET